MSSEGVTFPAFSSVSSKLTSDKSFMLDIIEVSALCFQYASQELRDDDEVATAAINGWPNQIAFASERIRSSKKFQVSVK